MSSGLREARLERMVLRSSSYCCVNRMFMAMGLMDSTNSVMSASVRRFSTGVFGGHFLLYLRNNNQH